MLGVITQTLILDEVVSETLLLGHTMNAEQKVSGTYGRPPGCFEKHFGTNSAKKLSIVKNSFCKIPFSFLEGCFCCSALRFNLWNKSYQDAL